MPLQICECGAKCRFPASALGRRGKCPTCGAVLTLTGAEPTNIIPIADEPAVPDVTPTARAAGFDAPQPISSPPIIEAPASSRGYAASVLDAFLFAWRLDNLITFLVLWICLAIGFTLLSFLLRGGFRAFIIGIFFALMIHGWYAAYRFAIVGNAASGDDDLPNISGSRDDFVEYASAAFSWVGTWILVMLPAGIYMLLRPAPLAGGPGAFTGDLLNFLVQSADTVWFLVLLIAGLAAWPIVVLCVSLGGFGCLVHLDLLIRTVVRTASGYLSTVILVLATFALDYALKESLLNPSTSSGPIPGGQEILASFLVMGVTTYFDIVAMKLIGLYYHHFKDKFAWNWG